MKDKRVAYKNEDGGVSVICPTPEFAADPASNLGLLLSRSVPLGIHFEVLDVSDVPTDRYFRNAWRMGAPLSKTIEVDMPAARAIHLDCLRAKRNKKLEELDVPFQRALEDKDTVMQDNIASKKNKLRDMPQDVDMSLLDTPDKIKAFMPDVLV